MQVHIDNMTCDGCVRSVTKAVQKVDADAKVVADLSTHTVDIQTGSPRELIIETLGKAGYNAK